MASTSRTIGRRQGIRECVATGVITMRRCNCNEQCTSSRGLRVCERGNGRRNGYGNAHEENPDGLLMLLDHPAPAAEPLLEA